MCYPTIRAPVRRLEEHDHVWISALRDIAFTQSRTVPNAGEDSRTGKIGAKPSFPPVPRCILAANCVCHGRPNVSCFARTRDFRDHPAQHGRHSSPACLRASGGCQRRRWRLNTRRRDVRPQGRSPRKRITNVDVLLPGIAMAVLMMPSPSCRCSGTPATPSPKHPDANWLRAPERQAACTPPKRALSLRTCQKPATSTCWRKPALQGVVREPARGN